MTFPTNFDTLFHLSNLAPEFFIYTDAAIDWTWFNEMKFIDKTFREWDLCPLCYKPVSVGIHGSWCK